MALFPYMRNIFLFNSQNKPIITGQVQSITPITIAYTLRYFAMLFLLIALPLIVLIVALVSWAGYSVRLMLPVQLLVGGLVCAYLSLAMHLRWRRLATHGHILYGEIIHSDTQPSFNLSTTVTTRITYRIITPQNQRVIDTVDLRYPAQRLPDGRRYPGVGARIAVLYVDQENHTLL
jgi:hypothetical protein